MSDEKLSLHLEPISESDKVGIHKESRNDLGMNLGKEEMIHPEAVVEKVAERNEKSEVIFQKILTASSQQSPVVTEDASKDAQMVAAAVDAESQVKQLVDLAMVKGVVHAVKVAKKMNDFYVLDQMHDDLANRLYDSLKEKGLIENEQ